MRNLDTIREKAYNDRRQKCRRSFFQKRKSEESNHGIPCSRAERSARRLCSIHHGLRRGGRDDDHSAVLFHHGGRAVGLDLHLPRADGHAGVEAAQKHRPQAHSAAHAALRGGERDGHPLHRLDGPARDDHGVRRVPDAARRLSAADGKEGGHPCDAGGHRRLRPARGRLRGAVFHRRADHGDLLPCRHGQPRELSRQRAGQLRRE